MPDPEGVSRPGFLMILQEGFVLVSLALFALVGFAIIMGTLDEIVRAGMSPVILFPPEAKSRAVGVVVAMEANGHTIYRFTDPGNGNVCYITEPRKADGGVGIGCVKP